MQRAAGRELEAGGKKGREKGEGKCRAGKDAGEYEPRGLLENEGVDGSPAWEPCSSCEERRGSEWRRARTRGEEGREGRRVESGGGGGGDDSGGVPPTLQKLVRPRERFSEQRGNERGGGEILSRTIPQHATSTGNFGPPTISTLLLLFPFFLVVRLFRPFWRRNNPLLGQPPRSPLFGPLR